MLNIFNFCKKDDTRAFCRQPFNHSGYTVATSGAAIIFSTLETEFSKNPNPAHDISYILNRTPKQIDTDLFDDVDKELFEKTCPFCHNSNGVLYDDEGYKCNSCDSGMLKYYKIDGRFFNKKYIDLINHPETRISSVIMLESYPLEVEGLFFRNNEQFGLIMRLRNDPAKF